MRVIHAVQLDTGDLPEGLPLEPSVCALGTFDGVHLGHQAVLNAAREQARALSLQAVVFSFQGHPQHVLSQTPVPLLSSLEERLALFQSMGFDVAVVPAFTPQLMKVSAAHFVSDILVSQLNVRHVVVGYDFHFGLHRQGDGALLKALGNQSNPPFKTTIMQPVTLADHQIISSTQIRKLLQYGDVTQAAALLGRPYDISGVLTTGYGRASQLGFPTANITPDAQRLMPAVGVYMGYLQLLEPNRPAQSGFKLSSSPVLNPLEPWPAVCNIGFSPTVLLGSDRPSAPRLEVHALLAQGQVFPKLPQGSLLSFSFLRRLRDEQKFESLEALIAQIGLDCDHARDAFHQLMTSKVDSF